jgi:hypothetical protein
MADQLTPDAMQRLAASGYGGCALQVLLLWELLALGAIHGKLPPEVALQLLRPGVMRLAQRLALLTPHELPAAERSASPTTQAVADVSGITQVYGSLLALNWQQVVVASASTAPSSHPAIAGVWSQQQIGALQTYQVGICQLGVMWRCAACRELQYPTGGRALHRLVVCVAAAPSCVTEGAWRVTQAVSCVTIGIDVHLRALLHV